MENVRFVQMGGREYACRQHDGFLLTMDEIGGTRQITKELYRNGGCEKSVRDGHFLERVITPNLPGKDAELGVSLSNPGCDTINLRAKYDEQGKLKTLEDLVPWERKKFKIGSFFELSFSVKKKSKKTLTEAQNLTKIIKRIDNALKEYSSVASSRAKTALMHIRKTAVEKLKQVL